MVLARPDCFGGFYRPGQNWSMCEICPVIESCKIQAPAPAPSANDEQFGGDHYKRMTVQPWDVVDTWPRADRIAYYRGNALKYIMRLNDKDVPITNAEKAAHYCRKLVEVLSEA